MPWSPHLIKTSGDPLYFKEHEKPLSKAKTNQSQRVLLLLRLNLCVERLLGVMLLKCTVRVLSAASGIDGYFNLCLGICSNGKFQYLSPTLFKTTLIRKLFFILKQTSVMSQSPFCSYFCPLKLHGISLIPFPFYSSTESSMQLSYHSLLFCNPFQLYLLFFTGSILFFTGSFFNETLCNSGHLPLDTINLLTSLLKRGSQH